ncbi:hypothetical protein ACET3Z_028042 [Daucus carota]
MPLSDSDPLFQFLQSYDRFVHPNTRPLVLKGDRYGIQMALNQIHYGSIEEARRLKKISSPPVEVNLNESNPLATQNSPTKIDPSMVLKNFIRSFRHLVEPSVYSDALQGFDKAISLALGQIHHKTLPTGIENPPHNSYIEVLTRGEGLVTKDMTEPKQNKSSAGEIHYDSLSPPSPIIEMESKGRDLEGDAMDDRASKNSDIASDKISEVNNDERLTPKSDVVGDITVGGTDISEAEVEDSLLNPLTPRTSGHLNQPVSSDHSVEEVQIFQTANWKPREKDSSFSMIQLQSEKEDNDSDYNPLEDLSYICNSH